MNPVKESTSKAGASPLKSGNVKVVVESEDISEVGVGVSIAFEGSKSVSVDEGGRIKGSFTVARCQGERKQATNCGNEI